MLSAIDHIIIGVHDLEQAEHVFRDNLGLVPSGGGIHPSGGTANRIIVIGDTYLELISVRTPAEAQASLLTRMDKGDGYLNFVLASDDIEADSATMKERGISLFGPAVGQLKSSDGRVRGWKRVDIERPDLAQHYPFLIQHDSSGEERRRCLAGWTTPPEHPLGAMKVLSVTLAVPNLAEAVQRFQHIYDLSPSPTFTGEVDGWAALLIAFPLAESGQSVELAEPLPLADERNAALDGKFLPEPGVLAEHLRTFGESLCRITLAVNSLSTAQQYLDTHDVMYLYEETPHGTIWIAPQQACGTAIVLHEIVRS